MKTKEELNKLKEEIEAVNEKLQELTEEELAQVSGGVPSGFITAYVARAITPDILELKATLGE